MLVGLLLVSHWLLDTVSLAAVKPQDQFDENHQFEPLAKWVLLVVPVSMIVSENNAAARDKKLFEPVSRPAIIR